jgi:hypothetical protein
MPYDRGDSKHQPMVAITSQHIAVELTTLECYGLLIGTSWDVLLEHINDTALHRYGHYR